MEIKGKLVQVLKEEKGVSKAGKEWTKGGFILDTGDQYNPNVCVGLFGDKLDLLQYVKVGDNVTASVNISSREHNGKWYTQCDGWRVQKEDESSNEPIASGGDEIDGSQDLPF